MAHTPHTPEAGPKDQATILKYLVTQITQDFTEDQRRRLLRAFIHFRQNIVCEAPASSTDKSKEDLS